MHDYTSVRFQILNSFIDFFTQLFNRWKRALGVLAGVGLLAPFAVQAKSPDYVDIGTAGNFAILAKTGISVTGPSSIIGNIGVSPVAATYITGFGLIADASTAFSTSSLITGKVYASDYTDPTPTKMTTAIGDMETAYGNAAGRTLPDFTELYTGDITGKTLVPGLYNWSTTVLVAAAGVTLSGSPTDVWIFQIAQNLELASSSVVTLSGGAKASNIYWQVAGQVSLGTTASMQGIILCQTAIVMNTGATLTGRALAQTAVTLDANTVINPVSFSSVIPKITQRTSPIELTYSNKSFYFSAPSTGKTTLKIVNSRGQEIASLFSASAQAHKNYRVPFNSTGFSYGIYFAKLESNGNEMLMKIRIFE